VKLGCKDGLAEEPGGGDEGENEIRLTNPKKDFEKLDGVPKRVGFGRIIADNAKAQWGNRSYTQICDS